MHNERESQSSEEPQAAAQRPVWTTPAIRRFKAGDAENGIVNNVSDGTFTFRS